MNIEIYSTRTCMYCAAAKSLLNQRKLPFTEVDLTHDHKLRAEITQKTKHRTVPQIFINDQFIGGYTELAEHLNKVH